MEGMVRTIVQLTETQAATLKQLASQRATSVAALVREAVERAYGDEQRKRAERVERARAAVGSARGGPADLAENHDEYYAQAIAEHLGENRR